MKPRVLPLLLLCCVPVLPSLSVAQAPASAPALSPAQINEGVRLALGTVVNQGLAPNDIKISPPALFTKAEPALTEAKKADVYARFSIAFNDTVSRVAPKAADLIKTSLKDIKIEDANALLTGRPDAITEYLRKSTGAKLKESLSPIVQGAATNVSLSVKAKEVFTTQNSAGVRGSAMALTTLEDHIRDQVIIESFRQIAKKEAAVRKDPAQLKNSLAQKVFESVKK